MFCFLELRIFSYTSKLSKKAPASGASLSSGVSTSPTPNPPFSSLSF
jgi:hypothetical protein